MLKKTIFSILIVVSTIALLTIISFQGRNIPSSAQEKEENTSVVGIREELILKNQDIEITSPKYGQVFELGEKIVLSWNNKNPEREYYYSPYFYYVIGDFQMASSHRITEEMFYTISPFQKSVIVLQLYYYDAQKHQTPEQEEYTYGSDILVLGIGMDIPEYWLKRFDKNRTEDPTPPQPIASEEPAPTPTVIEHIPAPIVKEIPKPKPTPKPTPKPLPKPKVEETILGENVKPFIFPFLKPVGVSQWHGYTAFQKPHTGIDFSVAKQNTIAVGDGVVVGRGYDRYYGECLSGGNFLTIQHDNGMYTVYFHLEQSYVDVGRRVKKGEVIAKTGNSGKWNCQPLAYHLHFETRKARSQSTHVNPVEYIAQDWNLIPTADYKKYPGRLTGDNPHPGR